MPSEVFRSQTQNKSLFLDVCIFNEYTTVRIFILESDSSVCVCLQVIILIGNKADLEAQRDVTYEEAKQFAEENGEIMGVMQVSTCIIQIIIHVAP